MRAVRAGFVGLLTVALSAAAHVAGGGMALPISGFVALSLVTGVFCWRLSWRRWTPRTLIATFLLVQAAVHWIAAAQHASMEMSLTTMALSHVGAAVLLMLLVRYGEDALWRLVENLALRAVALLRRTVYVRRLVLPGFASAWVPKLLRLCRPPGRGPPSFLVFAS